MVTLKHIGGIAVIGAAAVMLLQPGAKLIPKAQAEAAPSAIEAPPVARLSWSDEWHSTHKAIREDFASTSSF